MPGLLSPLLDPARISLHVRSNKRAVALNEVARLLEGHPDVLSFPGFYQELLARERIDTTCLGYEIALPHARTEHVRRMVLAIGRSDTGVRYDQSEERVRLFFVLGTPRNNPTDYLQVVSALCKLLKSPACREALFSAATPAEFITVLAEAESQLPPPAKPIRHTTPAFAVASGR